MTFIGSRVQSGGGVSYSEDTGTVRHPVQDNTSSSRIPWTWLSRGFCSRSPSRTENGSTTVGRNLEN